MWVRNKEKDFCNLRKRIFFWDFFWDALFAELEGSLHNGYLCSFEFASVRCPRRRRRTITSYEEIMSRYIFQFGCPPLFFFKKKKKGFVTGVKAGSRITRNHLDGIATRGFPTGPPPGGTLKYFRCSSARDPTLMKIDTCFGSYYMPVLCLRMKRVLIRDSS